MKYIYCTILICFSTYISSTAQKVGIDPSFQPKGPFLGTIDKMALQADGKILIIGNFTKYDGIEVGGIARLHSNGQLDTSFKTGLGFFVKINHIPNCIHIQNDGKILIGGRFNSYNTTYAINIVRLNQDGTADTSFNATNVSGFNETKGTVYAIQTQSDGKIIASGDFDVSDKFESWNLIRFHPNGSLDKSFTLMGGVHGYTSVKLNCCSANITDLAIQEDGKIILVGNFHKHNLLNFRHIMRLNADGTVDSSFKIGLGTDNIIQSVFLQKDGKIIISGWFGTYNGIARSNMARLNQDGSLDSGFIAQVDNCSTFCTMVSKLLPDGRILNSSNNMILEPNGTADTILWRKTSFNYGAVSHVLDQADGKILVCGNFGNYEGQTARGILRFEASPVGVSQLNREALKFNVFPNPMQDYADIVFENPVQHGSLIVTNLLGETLLHIPHITGTSYRLERQAFPAGMYILNLATKHAKSSKKLIVID